MIKKTARFIRDICMLTTLVFLASIALSRQVTFLQAHKKSVAHELDQDFLNQLYVTRKLVHMIKELFALHPDDAPKALKIKEWEIEIDQCETKYKENSPGLIVLGPFGTASIVMKEMKISKKLLALNNEIMSLLASLVNESYATTTSISQALQKNTELVAKLEERMSDKKTIS